MMMVWGTVKAAAAVVTLVMVVVAVAQGIAAGPATTTAPAAGVSDGARSAIPARSALDTLDSLIAQNERARSRIQTASYVVEFEHQFSRDREVRDAPPGYRRPLERKGTVEVIQKGNLRYTDRVEHVRFADGGADQHRR